MDVPGPASTTAVRVLIVEDRATDRELVLAALRRAGFVPEARFAEDEAQLVSGLAWRPDVLLCDYALPQLTGTRALEVAAELAPDIPVIVVTGTLGEERAVDTIRLGAVDYLLKDRLGRLGPAVANALEQRDIRMQRARAEAQLRESEAHFRQAFEYSAAGMALVALDGTWLQVNAALERMLGTSEVELVKRGFAVIVHPESVPALDGGLRRLADRGADSFEEDARFFRSDGTVIWGHVSASLVRDQDDRPVHFVLQVLDVSVQRAAESALREADRRRQWLSQRVLAVQEEERARLARELHDEFGQALTGLKITLQTLARQPAVAPLGERLAQSVAFVDDLLRSARRLAGNLRPPQLDQLGLAAAVRFLAERQAEAGRVQIDLAISADVDPVPADIATACFRIVQESLTNVLRHAAARKAQVALDVANGELLLYVSDDGHGFDPGSAAEHAVRRGSVGLLGMAERAALVGGRVTVESAPGRGTQIRARFPLDAERAGSARTGEREPP